MKTNFIYPSMQYIFTSVKMDPTVMFFEVVYRFLLVVENEVSILGDTTFSEIAADGLNMYSPDLCK